MMQNLAPQRQNVAALPIDIERPAPASDAVHGFGEVMQQAAAATSNKSSKNKQPSEPAGTSTTPAPVTSKSKTTDADTSVSDKASATPATGSRTESATDKTSAINDNADVSAPADPAQDIAGKQADAADVDWLEYVNRIRNLEQDQGSPEQPDVTAPIAPIVKGEDALQIISDELASQNNQLLFEAGDVAPKAGDEQKVTPIPVLVGTLAKEMLKQLGGSGDDGEAGETQASAEDIDALAAAIIEVLGAGQDNAGDTGEEQLESDSFLAELARLQQAQQRKNEDTSLLSQLLNTELGQTEQGTATATTTASPGDGSLNLLEQLSQLSVQGQQQMSQALSERIAELAPAQTSEANKAQLVAAVLSGLKEMQDQMAQGHQPGFSVTDMVAQAMTESGVEVTPLLHNHIDQQVTQLAAIASAGSSTAQLAASMHNAAAVASVDTQMAEHTQLRSEASAATKQAEGLDNAVNIQQPDGQKQLAEKVRWMVNSRNMMAEIRLDPPEMGSMQVRVNVQGDAAAVSFVVQSAQAKDVLLEAEPRLREMLAEQGIALGESSVEQQNQSGDDSQGQHAGKGSGQGDAEAGTDDSTIVSQQSLSRQAQGGIDDYA
ncbi:flagellar hook-length control protein FliK [Salinimonas marina]|uniref:Flagellar hook-length control protein FliK n=1 Tax=Salinimonas marina TaxID=2785918 RepID=A0A7S9HC92_9ALTE|nr:flagellar hook-length control protein FliK [Salinimonas marina]QPG04940.1 flagellar hook-length control protein FliK [Salinimonas marina]